MNMLMAIPNALARGVIRIAEPKVGPASQGEKAVCALLLAAALVSFLAMLATK